MNAFNIVMIAIGICAAAVLTALLKGAIAAGKDKSRDTAKCPVCGKVFPVLADDETTTFGYHLRVGSPCGEKFLHDWMMGWVPNKDAELKTVSKLKNEIRKEND